MDAMTQMPLQFSEQIEYAEQSFTEWKIVAQSLAERARTSEARLALARSLCVAVLDHYWTSLCRRHDAVWDLRPLPLPIVPLTDPSASFARLIGTTAAGFAPLHAGYLISSLYTIMLPDETRSRLGAYYTPPVLVERLLDMVTEAGFNWEKGRILDPACGGGAFLAPLAIRLVEALHAADPAFVLRNIATRLRGFEIDPFAAWMSMVFLESALLPLCLRVGKRLPELVTVGDALSMPIEERLCHDLVIGNPPYGKVTLSDPLRHEYRRSLHGHANLYGLFTDLAIRWTRPGGLIAYVTPTSFLGGQYFKALRQLLRNEAPPLMFDFITERRGVFEDVLQETMLSVYRRATAPDQPLQVHFLQPNGAEKPVRIRSAGNFSLPAHRSDPWLLPREPDQTQLLRQMAEMPHRLADYAFTVTTGQLVWNRHKEQLTDVARKDCLPLIWAESVLAEGQFRFSATRRNHSPYFRLRAGQNHLVTSESCILVQRTTAKEQRRRLIAAVLPAALIKNHGGVVVENHLNMIRPFSGKPSIPFKVWAALLNTRTLDRAFRCISGSVAVSAYELNALPLPAPDAMQRIAELVKSGSSPEALEQVVAAIYGVSHP